jgi:hypothetical protein
MTQLLSPQTPRPREPDTRSEAALVVVCPLESSREGQHAVAVAASLSRGLGAQLALVPGGSTPLDPAPFAAAAAEEHAGLIVISAAPAQARALAVLAGCPVVVVPAVGPAPRPFDEGPVVCALDRTADAVRVAGAATRFALQLGATLRLVHIGSGTTVEDVPAIANTMGATLLVVSADGQRVNPELILEATDIPVMLIPLGVAQSARMRRVEGR